MKKSRKYERGFSLNWIVVALFVVLVIGFGGWMAIRESGESTPVRKTQNIDSVKPDESLEGGKYLVIKEWDVKIPLSNELAGDTEYGLFKSVKGEEVVYFASKKLAAKSMDGLCGLKALTDSSGMGVSGGSVALSRFSAKPDATISDLTFHHENYWYVLDFSNGGACYEGDSGQETHAFKTAMSSALRNLRSQ